MKRPAEDDARGQPPQKWQGDWWGSKGDSWKGKGDSWQGKGDADAWQGKGDSWKGDSWQGKGDTKGDSWQWGSGKADSFPSKGDGWKVKGAPPAWSGKGDGKGDFWQGKADSWQGKGEDWKGKGAVPWKAPPPGGKGEGGSPVSVAPPMKSMPPTAGGPGDMGLVLSKAAGGPATLSKAVGGPVNLSKAAGGPANLSKAAGGPVGPSFGAQVVAPPALSSPPPFKAAPPGGPGDAFQWGGGGDYMQTNDLLPQGDPMMMDPSLMNPQQLLQKQNQDLQAELMQQEAELQRQEAELRREAQLRAVEEKKHAAEVRMRELKEKQQAMMEKKKAEEDRKKQEAIEVAKTLQGELNTLLQTCGLLMDSAKTTADQILIGDIKDKSDEDILTVSEDFDKLAQEGRTSHKVCTDYTTGKHLKISGVTEETKKDSAGLMKKMADIKKELEQCAAKVKAKAAPAKERREKEKRMEAARLAREKEERTFKQYDVDEDGVLNTDEIKAYAKGEYAIDLSDEKLERIVKSDALPKPTKKKAFVVDEKVQVGDRKAVISYGPDTDGEYKVRYSDGEVSDYTKAELISPATDCGTPLSLFAQLKTQVGIIREEIRAKERKQEAEDAVKRVFQQTIIVKKNVTPAEQAIEVVEQEVLKVEKKTGPLAFTMGARAPAFEVMEDRADEVGRLADAAKDFLEAAKEAASSLAASIGREPEPSVAMMITVESKKLGMKLKNLEGRLSRVTGMVEQCQKKVALARAKQNLMREVIEAQHPMM